MPQPARGMLLERSVNFPAGSSPLLPSAAMPSATTDLSASSPSAGMPALLHREHLRPQRCCAHEWRQATCAARCKRLVAVTLPQSSRECATIAVPSTSVTCTGTACKAPVTETHWLQKELQVRTIPESCRCHEVAHDGLLRTSIGSLRQNDGMSGLRNW